MIQSKRGTQTIYVERTNSGITIRAVAANGSRTSIHLFDECIDGVIRKLIENRTKRGEDDKDVSL